MTIRIVQSWIHIEDIFEPSFAQKIRQVLDVYTNQTIIPIDLNKIFFIGLKIIGRNPYTAYQRELAFIDKSEDNKSVLLVNLDPLESFPIVDEQLMKIINISNPPKDLRHIRIEIVYINTKPFITQFKSNVIYPQKMVINEFDGFLQPEFYITLPLGWKMSGGRYSDYFHKFINIFQKKKRKFLGEGDGVLISCVISPDKVEEAEENQGISLQTPKSEEYELILDKPFIGDKNGKIIYNYLISPRQYNQLLKKYQTIQNSPNKRAIHFRIVHATRRTPIINIVSLIPLFFLIISCIMLRDIGNVIFNSSKYFPYNLQFLMAFLLSILGFSYFYLSVKNKGIYIPRDTFNQAIGGISYITVLLLFFINTYILPCPINC